MLNSDSTFPRGAINMYYVRQQRICILQNAFEPGRSLTSTRLCNRPPPPPSRRFCVTFLFLFPSFSFSFSFTLRGDAMNFSNVFPPSRPCNWGNMREKEHASKFFRHIDVWYVSRSMIASEWNVKLRGVISRSLVCKIISLRLLRREINRENRARAQWGNFNLAERSMQWRGWRWRE